MDFWLEIVTLVISGFNDSDEELTRLAEFLASVSPDIPWHVTAFHKDYKMTDPENTRPETLTRAAEIGKKAGLQYVYAGNLPGMVGDWENTRCPKCQELLIERYGFLITGYFLTPQGCCPSCGASIPGRWDPAFRRQITARPFVPRMRSQPDLLVLDSYNKKATLSLSRLVGQMTVRDYLDRVDGSTFRPMLHLLACWDWILFAKMTVVVG